MSATATAAAAVQRPFRGSHLVIHEVGEGPEVGYLHGMCGNPSGFAFLDALASAGAGRRVLAPGLPGFSGSPAHIDMRTLFDWVVATSEAIDLAGAAGRPFVASSVGAMLALEVAAVRPEAFERLVLISPLGLFDMDDPVADAFGTTLSNQRLMLTADRGATDPFFKDGPLSSPAQLIEDGIARYEARTAAMGLLWPIPEFGLDSRIHRVSCPVTLIWGSQDAINPVSYLARYQSRLANVTATHVVEGAGHLAEWDQPDAIAALVDRALS